MPPASTVKPQIVTINSKRDGFRRAGMVHPGQPTEYRFPGEITADQIAICEKEPMLMVTVKDAPAEPLEMEKGKK